MLKYNKLFELLQASGKSKTNWLRQNGIHSVTVNKLRKNENVSTETIEAICKLLNCQPGDIMEYVPDE